MIDFACKRFDINEIIKCSLGLTKADYKIMNHFLIKENEWTTTTHLAKELKLNLSTIQRCVKTLHEKEIIHRAQENLSGGGYTYIYKIKDKKELRTKIKTIVDHWVKTVDNALNKW
ncbi:MarR family transcriptional regulator [Candidatus Woesearchaeota archaeon]|nr:MarR family transcriptional regulator [Candidatus Woesearchaeota archaeon]MCF8013002.1 MarR family transcriptional regulator [Candidatus Woesearchaeota archaeon]